MSNAFVPYRSLGFITDDVPFHVKRLGNNSFATTAIGRAWQVFNLDKLRVVAVSPPSAQRIVSLASHRELTYTTHGTDVAVWRRMDKVALLQGGHQAQVYRVQLIGQDLLLSVCEEGRLCVWQPSRLLRRKEDGDDDEEEAESALLHQIDLSGQGKVMSIAHPHTYLNKVLVAFDSGAVQLWNIRTATLVHQFTSFAPVPVHCVEQSPVVDVVAFGMHDGRIVLHNIRLDQTIATFVQSDGGPVTSVSFRTDAPSKKKENVAMMVSGGQTGDVAVWDLERRELLSLVRGAHDGAVVSAHFLAGEPVLLTSGTDNALRMWVFDQADHSARLLRSRAGHAGPPRRLAFVADATNVQDGGVNTATVVSAGLDRSLRSFSVFRDRQTAEFSQRRPVDKRKSKYALGTTQRTPPVLAPVLDLAVGSVRERDWANMLTCHVDDTKAHTWSTRRHAMETQQLGRKRVPGAVDATATAVALSVCGNFGVVGYSDGAVVRFNMQSGIMRGDYVRMESEGVDQIALETEVRTQLRERPSLAERMQARPQKRPAHDARICGMAVDSLNRTLVTAGLDGVLRFWNFNKRTLEASLDLGAPAALLRLHQESDLAAVALDNFTVLVVDITTRRVVRRFSKSQAPITDVAFSPNAHWLVVAALDGHVRVFDLPSARMIDWMYFDQAAMTLAFSPKGDFLASGHADTVGVFLWANRAYFGNAKFGYNLSEPVVMDGDLEMNSLGVQAARAAKIAADAEGASSSSSSLSSDRDKLFSSVAVKQLPFDGAEETELITFSELPKARWQTLSRLDVIKARNKPAEAPKAPEAAPFFLGTTTSLVQDEVDEEMADAEAKTNQASSAAAAAAAAASASHVIKSSGVVFGSDLERLLRGDVSGAKSGTSGKRKREDEAGEVVAAQTAERVLAHLKSLGPSAIDAELRLLTANVDSEEGNLARMLGVFTVTLQSKKDFEFTQALLNVFLRAHGETLVQYPRLVDKLKVLKRTQKKAWRRLEHYFQSSLCMVSFFTKTQLI